MPVLGLSGIGKSSLVKNTLHFVSDRKYFTGGILYVQSEGVRKCYILLKLIMKSIAISLDLKESSRRDFELQYYSREAKTINFLVNFFNNRHGLKLKPHKHAADTDSK